MVRQTGHMIRSFPLFVLGSGLSVGDPFEPLHKTGEAGSAKIPNYLLFEKYDILGVLFLF